VRYEKESKESKEEKEKQHNAKIDYQKINERKLPTRDRRRIGPHSNENLSTREGDLSEN
jgi:hypothetical protein